MAYMGTPNRLSPVARTNGTARTWLIVDAAAPGRLPEAVSVARLSCWSGARWACHFAVQERPARAYRGSAKGPSHSALMIQTASTEAARWR